MRYLLVCCLAIAALLPVAARADDPVTLAPAIAQCINDNAAKVEATVEDLGKAVEFLVSDVCAEPVSAEQSRVLKAQTEAQAAQMQKMCDESKTQSTSAKSDKGAGNVYCSYVRASFLTEPGEMSYTIYAPSLSSAPPAAIALAAKRLLDLRLSHAKTKASGG